MGLVSRNLLITLILSLVSVGVGAWAGAKIFSEEPRAPSLHEFVHDELHLTDQQKAQLDALEQEFAVRRKAREAELLAANAALAAAIQAGHTYSPEVQVAVERFHRAMGELQKETILHVLDMRRLLTPAQAARYDVRISQALTEDTR